MEIKRYSAFPKVLHYWILTIRLFSVISKMLVGGSLIRLQRGRPCILQPQPTGIFVEWREIRSNKSTIKAYPCIRPRKCVAWVQWHIKHWRLLNAKSTSYIFIKYMIWFVCVSWHINHYWLFNAKSTLYIYIKYIRFGLVGLYAISTIVGYINQGWLFNAKSSLYISIKYK